MREPRPWGDGMMSDSWSHGGDDCCGRQCHPSQREGKSALSSPFLLPSNLLSVPPTGQTWELQFAGPASVLLAKQGLDLRARRQMSHTDTLRLPPGQLCFQVLPTLPSSAKTIFPREVLVAGSVPALMSVCLSAHTSLALVPSPTWG